MSTIASPRDPSTPLARRMNSTTAAITPTSSSRPSLDLGPSSTSVSPNPNTSATAAAPPRRANRAALREYYNIKKSSAPTTPTVEITNPLDAQQPFYNQNSDTLPADAALDSPTFDADAYVAQALECSTLAELLRTYARVLGEIRALDAEKKALVYDNYSKLISATETIRRIQSTMDPLNPMASTLDLVVAKIYEQASGMREGLRGEIGPPAPERGDRALDGRRRTRELVAEVLEVPGRLRRLVEEGREEEAKREWEVPRRLLERWRERGLGGGMWML
ncbi:Vps51/Vps67-domain-containing protein [Lasiosphaeris hirsuta]|uniref:Vacuolar protein sorting-associated protein 51 homolog n=1 Tax=Lasiosphaeris hirsuta TaxID=260670 RepID=A0AA40E2B7_9PEZI|nr:Vps51/Vps67-domain-containing protein [Lasiosphaeris hirsuta]